jgi:hypothetical protein
MELTLILLLACLCLLTPAIGLGIYQFTELRHIKGVTYVSIGSWGEVLILLSKYSTIESPEQHLAKLAKLSPEEVARVIEKNGIIGLLEGIAKTNLEMLKTNVPDARKILSPIEARYPDTKEPSVYRRS